MGGDLRAHSGPSSDAPHQSDADHRLVADRGGSDGDAETLGAPGDAEVQNAAVIRQFLDAVGSGAMECVPHAVQQAQLVSLREGRFERDQAWCGGRWPAALLAQMAEAARE